jgi:hypothetical protein
MQKFNLLKDRQVYRFLIVGFDDIHAYGEVYLTENNRKTFIYRGSDVKKVIKLAKKEAAFTTQSR